MGILLENPTACSNAFNGKSFAVNTPLDGIQFSPQNNTTDGTVWGTARIVAMKWVADQLVGQSTIAKTQYDNHLLTLEIDFIAVNSNAVKGTFQRQFTLLGTSIPSSGQLTGCFATTNSVDICSQLGGTYSAGQCQLPNQFVDQTVYDGKSCSGEYEGKILANPASTAPQYAAAAIYICQNTGSGLVYHKMQPNSPPWPAPKGGPPPPPAGSTVMLGGSPSGSGGSSSSGSSSSSSSSSSSGSSSSGSWGCVGTAQGPYAVYKGGIMCCPTPNNYLSWGDGGETAVGKYGSCQCVDSNGFTTDGDCSVAAIPP